MKFYVCNGKRPECEGKKSVCRVKGGCFYTTDIFCALYDTHEEFEPVYHKNEPPDYFEVIRTPDKKRLNHGII